MDAFAKQPGIAGTFEPVDWNPPGLPTDPDEIVAHILNPATRGELYPLYHQLRRVAPVFKGGPSSFHGAWIFSRFAEIDALFRNPRVTNDPKVLDSTFTSGDGSFRAVMRGALSWQPIEPHARMRALIMAAFTPRAIDRWRPISIQVAGELCDRIEAGGDSLGGRADLVEQFNYILPFNIIARILGVPEEDHPRLKTWCWNFARMGESRGVDIETAKRGDEAARGLTAYFGDLAERRRSAPGEDLMSSLVTAEVDGKTMTQDEVVANCIYLFQAGHETTQDLLGNAMVALFRHPDQLKLLKTRPELTEQAVEELLRYDGSVQVNHTVGLDPLTFDGNDLPENALIYSFIGAACRDPARYKDADRLDIMRQSGAHLSFRAGAYYCIGAALARTEIAAGLRTLLDRFPDIHPATGEFEWRTTLLLRGPQVLEVGW